MAEFCPSCGMARVGAFRFCRGCRFDYDAAAPGDAMAPPTVASATDPRVALGSNGSGLTRRRILVGGFAVVFGLAAIGSLSKAPPTSSAAALGPTAPPVAVATTTAPTPTTAPAATPEPSPVITPEPTFGPSGPTESARVTRVIDGDTIAVDIGGNEYKLRYIGMDTPETVDPSSPVEWMGPQAAAANQQLVSGKTVVLEKDVSETDQYGRLLRYVWLTDGASWTLVNLELVRLGVASVSTYPPDVRYVDLYLAAEEEARRSEVGLWGPEPTPKPTPKPTPRPTPKPTPRPTPKPTARPSSCHPSYKDACLKVGAGDYDCAGGSGNGPNYVRGPIRVVGYDEFDLDRDNDGIGCE